MAGLNEDLLQFVTEWAIRESGVGSLRGDKGGGPRGLLAGENVRVLPLACEFDGMGGCGKSRVISELGSHHFHGFGLDPLTYNEPNQAVAHVAADRPVALLEEERNLTVRRLDEVHSPTNVRAFAFFDRGIYDFIPLYNILFNTGERGISEEECREMVRQVLNLGKGRVDVVFVFTNSSQAAMQGKTVINSLTFMNSLGISGKSPEETYARFEFCQRMYREFFVQGKAVAGAVKQVVDVNVEKAGNDFDRTFAQVVVTLDIHLVFKVWESLFLARFGDELAQPKPDTEARIKSFAGKLHNPFVSLRKELLDSDKIPKGSHVRSVLESYRHTEFVIARVGDVSVTVRDIFGDLGKEKKTREFEVYGLKVK